MIAGSQRTEQEYGLVTTPAAGVDELGRGDRRASAGGSGRRPGRVAGSHAMSAPTAGRRAARRGSGAAGSSGLRGAPASPAAAPAQPHAPASTSASAFAAVPPPVALTASTVSFVPAAPIDADSARGRMRLLQVAMRRFAAQGFDGVTVRTIAAEAGVSPGLTKHHFGSNEGLRDAVDACFLRRSGAAFERAISATRGMEPAAVAEHERAWLALYADGWPDFVAYLRRAILENSAWGRACSGATTTRSGTTSTAWTWPVASATRSTGRGCRCCMRSCFSGRWCATRTIRPCSAAAPTSPTCGCVTGARCTSCSGTALDRRTVHLALRLAEAPADAARGAGMAPDRRGLSLTAETMHVFSV